MRHPASISSAARGSLATAAAVAVLGSLVTSAHARPVEQLAPTPCVNHSVSDHPGRDVHDVTATAAALVYCTGGDCWSLDAASSAIASVASIAPRSQPAIRQGEGKSADGRATATPTAATFCPSDPASCKTFPYKFAFQPQSGLYPMINAAGTLGAVIYKGLGEDGDPSYVLAFDLVAGKPIKQVTGTSATVYARSFLIDNAWYSAKLKKLGKLAVTDANADPTPITGTDLVALSDQKRGDLVLQDAATGKALPRIKLGKDVALVKKQASPDGRRLYVIAEDESAYEGEVFIVDVAKHKLVGHVVPTRCAAGTARAR
jgi:hypothetical protein